MSTLVEVGLDANIDLDISRKGECALVVQGPKSIVELYCRALDRDEILIFISQDHPITYTREMMQVAQIPETAKTMAFAYPAEGVSSLSQDRRSCVNVQDSRVAFIILGGFVYFDENRNVIQCNAIVRGSGLRYEGPFPLPPWVYETIKREGRFYDVTSEVLKSKRALTNAYMLPNEPYVEFLPEPIPHGGFAFELEGNQFCYFRLCLERSSECCVPLDEFDAYKLFKEHYANIVNQSSNSQNTPQQEISNSSTPVVQFVQELPIYPTVIPADAQKSEPAIKFDFDFATQKWTRTTIHVIIEDHPFSNGNMRYAYKMKDLTKPPGSQQEYVAKKSQDINEPLATYFADVEMQSMARYMANEFNKYNPPVRVEMIEASVIQCVNRKQSNGDPVFFNIEPYLQGKFVKLSNNYGWIHPDDRNTPQAFSHFTYCFSGGLAMVVDIQGVHVGDRDIYTDPQIHTSTQSSMEGGLANLGDEGIGKFFETHKCNSICKALSLPVKQVKQSDSGTKMKQPLMKPNNQHEAKRLRQMLVQRDAKEKWNGALNI